MRPSQALKLHKQEVDALFKDAEKNGIVNIRLIGSVAHGLDTDGSDIDFLVSTPKRGKLLKVLALADKLENLLQIHVNMLIEESLPVYLYYLTGEAVNYNEFSENADTCTTGFDKSG